ncbi:protein kinase [Nocardia sp. NPDC005978]|uniref:serine/threonine-protein kinase n=1 Tax=Nocardia sp. NPDC005978 TaxID=3156725 RepID=UPI0033A5A379
MPLLRGDVLSGYTIDRLIGEGELGAVYAARDSNTGRMLALRVIDDDFAGRDGARARFRREAALLVGVDHPNIASVDDYGAATDEQLWIAGQFIDGVDGAQLLENGPIAPGRAVTLIAAAAPGLDHAHREGILHGNIKPGNLIVRQDGGELRVLVTDFGIARALDDLGTASYAYTAPERFANDLPVDHRADVYSLGSVLYEFLTGRTPFPRTDPQAVQIAHRRVAPVAPSLVRPELTTAFDEVIATALAKDPEQRYQSCGALADAALAALTDASLGASGLGGITRQAAPEVFAAVAAPPAPPVVSAQARNAFRGSGVMLSAAAAVLVVGIVSVIAVEMNRDTDRPGVAIPAATSAVASSTEVTAPPATEPLPEVPPGELAIPAEPLPEGVLPEPTVVTEPLPEAVVPAPVEPLPDASLPVPPVEPAPETTAPATTAPETTVPETTAAEPLPQETIPAPVTTEPLTETTLPEPLPPSSDITAIAQAQCHGYVTLVQQNGEAGALAIVESQAAQYLEPVQDPAVVREAIRLVAAGQCAG